MRVFQSVLLLALITIVVAEPLPFRPARDAELAERGTSFSPEDLKNDCYSSTSSAHKQTMTATKSHKKTVTATATNTATASKSNEKTVTATATQTGNGSGSVSYTHLTLPTKA